MIVWLVVISEENTERTLSIPIVPYADREDLLWSNPSPGYALVRVQGKVRSIWWLEKITQPRLKLPLSSLPDSGYILLKPEMVEMEATSFVKIVALVKPDTLPVKVEKKLVRIIPIQPNIIIIPADGYIISQPPYTQPAKVEVSGKRKDVIELKAIQSDTIVIQNSNADGQLSARLLPITGVKLGLNEVTIRYHVERLVEETFHNVEVITPKGWIASPAWLTVTVQGGVSDIAKLKKQTLSAKVIASTSEGKVKPYFELSGTLKLIKVYPVEVDLTIK